MAEVNGAAPPEDRRKRTIWLLSGGAASLLLPLAGLAYIHWADTRPVPGPEGASDVFEHHDGQGPVIPSQVTPNVVALPPSAGAAAKPVSSLDFIKTDPDFAARAPAPAGATMNGAAPAAGAPAAASTATATAAAVKAKPASASAKKQFVMPKLQPGRGFTNFGSTGAGSAAAQQDAGAAGANAQQLMNLPPGAANNPEIQKYLQSQQGH